MNPQAVETEPSVTQALERVLVTSQRVVQDRTELVFLEVRELLGATFEGLLALGLAIGLLLIGWGSATATVVFLLSEVMSRGGALGVVTVINLLVGALLLRVALTKVASVRTPPASRRNQDSHTA